MRKSYHRNLPTFGFNKGTGITVAVNNFTNPQNILDQTSQIWFAYDDAENLESKIERCKMNEH